MNVLDIFLILAIFALSIWYFYPKPIKIYKHVPIKVVKKSFIDSITQSESTNYLVLFFASQTGTAQGINNRIDQNNRLIQLILMN